jgi:hypothetical protein
MNPSTTRHEKFRNMIGWTTNEHGRGSYSALKVEILHSDYSGVYDRQKVFLNLRLCNGGACLPNRFNPSSIVNLLFLQLFVALIRGPNAAIEMVKGNFAVRPMTETMEIIHGIRNITPGAIATTAMLVRLCFLHYLKITHYNRRFGVFQETTPFRNAEQPQASTTLPSLKTTSS